MKKTMGRLAVLVVCLFLLRWSVLVFFETEAILHNGTNVDDDGARILGFFSGTVGFVSLFIVWGVVLCIYDDLRKPRC